MPVGINSYISSFTNKYKLVALILLVLLMPLASCTKDERLIENVSFVKRCIDIDGEKVPVIRGAGYIIDLNKDASVVKLAILIDGMKVRFERVDSIGGKSRLRLMGQVLEQLNIGDQLKVEVSIYSSSNELIDHDSRIGSVLCE